MSIYRAGVSVVLVSCLFLSSGCFSVQDTGGVEACLTDIREMEMAAYQVKRQHPNAESDEYQRMQELYNRAAGSARGFLSAMRSRVEMTQEVNVPASDYAQHKASGDAKDFLEAAEDTRPQVTKGFDPGTATVIASNVVGIVGIVIDNIWDLDQKAKKEGVARFARITRESEPPPFDGVTEEYMQRRYSLGETDSEPPAR